LNKGDIYSVEFPIQGGFEQHGFRPTVIIADISNEIAVVIPFTSNLKSLKFPNSLLITSSIENGLQQDSVAMIFQIRAIDKIRIKKKIGHLENHYIERIDNLLRNMLKL
jgi:mRNA interferase MazF